MVRTEIPLKVQKYRHRTLKEVRKLSKVIPTNKRNKTSSLVVILLISSVLLIGTVKFLIKRKRNQQLLLESQEKQPEKKKAQFVLFKPGKNIEDAALEAKMDLEREKSEIEADRTKRKIKEDLENEGLKKMQTIHLLVTKVPVGKNYDDQWLKEQLEAQFDIYILLKNPKIYKISKISKIFKIS